VLRKVASENRSRNVFMKIVIPASQKAMFLRQLLRMNVSASSLFPGLDGLARSINEVIDVMAAPPPNQVVQSKPETVCS
jgi:hypothetical protein